VSVYVREFRFADGPQAARALRLAFAGDSISSLEDAEGREVPVFRLDPLLIGSIFRCTARTASSRRRTRCAAAARGAEGGGDASSRRTTA